MISCTNLDTIRIEVLGEGGITAPASVWLDWRYDARTRLPEEARLAASRLEAIRAIEVENKKLREHAREQAEANLCYAEVARERLEAATQKSEIQGAEHGANQMKRVIAEYLRGVGMFTLAEDVKENCHWPKGEK